MVLVITEPNSFQYWREKCYLCLYPIDFESLDSCRYHLNQSGFAAVRWMRIDPYPSFLECSEVDCLDSPRLADLHLDLPDFLLGLVLSESLYSVG